MVDNIVNTVVHCSLISSPNCSIIIKISLGRCKILLPVLLSFWDSLPAWGLVVPGEAQQRAPLSLRAQGLQYIQYVHYCTACSTPGLHTQHTQNTQQTTTSTTHLLEERVDTLRQEAREGRLVLPTVTL